MNKNKKLTYILLVVATTVWGYIMYQLLGSVWPDGDTVEKRKKAPPALEKMTGITDTFQINADYRDPFLGRNHKPKNSMKKTSKPKNKKHSQKQQQEQQKKKIDWSFIVYKGRIENQIRGRKVALLKINDTKRLLTAGDSTKEGVHVKAVFEDSIRVQYHTSSRTIYKQQTK